MELVLQRRPSLGGTTFGDLSIDGIFQCHTLEDQVREIVGQPVSAWKVPTVTAIPQGRYRLALVDSGRFGPDTLSLEDVPGFENIRIHSGNAAADTEGCLLVGEKINDQTVMLEQSRVALAKLKEKLIPVIKGSYPVFITIESC